MIAADARSGSTVGKYRLHEIVGRGGMGVVYRAEHVYIGREVAVKILHDGYGGREEAIKRFLREARAASLINHPNIVDVTDFGKANDGTVFFVMELLIGQSLDAVLMRERRLDLLRAITICNQLAAALAAAHHKDIIHRDLKPENVMLIEREGRRELVRRVTDEGGAHDITEREQKFDFVKILDFGVAKVREPPLDPQKARVTKEGVVFGTPEYMAPETARIGFSDARSDIYALGIMFYEMLTGTVPFTGDAPMDVMLKQVNSPVPPMAQVAPDAEITTEAERTILKALAKDPNDRQQTMEEFHRDLQKCYGQLRFRRSLRTPTDPGTAMDATAPRATPIPLTRRKNVEDGKTGIDGALPALLSASQSAPRAIVLGRGAPIQLTRRKGARPEPTAEPASSVSSASALTPLPQPEDHLPGPSQAALGAPPPPSPVEKRKRTTLPLPLGGHLARAAAAAPTSPPRSTTMPAPTSPPQGAHSSATPPLTARGAERTNVGTAPPEWAPLPNTAIWDRPTPRVDISDHLANLSSGLAVGDDDDGETGGTTDREARPPWFDGPTAVRNPLEAAARAGSKRPGSGS